MMRRRISSLTATRSGWCSSPIIGASPPCVRRVNGVSTRRDRGDGRLTVHSRLYTVCLLRGIFDARSGEDQREEATSLARHRHCRGGARCRGRRRQCRQRTQLGSGGGRRIDLDRARLGADQPRPAPVDDGGERAINDNIYETLLTRDAAGELGPGLATDLPTQIDDTTWEFTLRDDVTFHDGTPFNADSVVASVDRMIRLIADEKTDNSGFYSTLAGRRRSTTTPCDITTTEPDGVLPARMYWLKIVAPGTEDSDDLSDAPNGTGPYKFVGRETGVSIELAANPDYWGGAPSIANVHYEFVTEGGTRLAGLKSGQYRPHHQPGPEDVDQAPQPIRRSRRRSTRCCMLDADEGITADPNVRLALEPGRRQGRDRRSDLRRLCQRRPGPAAQPVDPRLQRHARRRTRTTRSRPSS